MSSKDFMHVVIEYFPIIKWVIGGLLGAVAVLSGYIWIRQQKEIKEMKVALRQLEQDSVRHVTQRDLQELRQEMEGKFDHLEDKVSESLEAHNKLVNGKLDKIMWYMVNGKTD
jgi:hypothetical protein